MSDPRARATRSSLTAAAPISHAEVTAIAHDRSLYFTEFDQPPGPDEILAWLARLRLLRGVPFAYLVNDPELLPVESIRFFYLDRNWTDAAVDGALSVGTITTRDRTQLRAVYEDLRDDVDVTERQLFQSLTSAEVTEGAAEVATGFILRSRAVSGWPGLHVHAYRGPGDDEELGIMRIERLAPAVLLVLIDGLPGYITITEPRQGIQFGVLPHSSQSSHRTFMVRDDDGNDLDDIDEDLRLVPFRDGSPGVIHWNELAERMARHLPEEPHEIRSAEVGLHVLDFPYQQDFGDPGDGDPQVPGDSVFRTNVPLELFEDSNRADWFGA